MFGVTDKSGWFNKITIIMHNCACLYQHILSKHWLFFLFITYSFPLLEGLRVGNIGSCSADNFANVVPTTLGDKQLWPDAKLNSAKDQKFRF